MIYQEKGALPEGEFELEWGDVFEMDEETWATVEYKRAMTVERLVNAGVIDEEEAREWFGLERD